MICVCGVDVGTFSSLSYIAWLVDGEFILDLYIPSLENPLPKPPSDIPLPKYIGFDAPQGLPKEGNKIRFADKEANTPTKKLPQNRKELSEWKLYKGLIEAGVEIFWTVYQESLATIIGFEHVKDKKTTIFETYPRYVIKRLWPDISIPSKRKAPVEYVDTIWSQIQKMGYTCDSVLKPAVDHVDAMLCAIAAEALLKNKPPEGTVGEKPIVDKDARVLREGFIISP